MNNVQVLGHKGWISKGLTIMFYGAGCNRISVCLCLSDAPMVIAEISQIECEVEAYVHRDGVRQGKLDDLVLVSSRLIVRGKSSESALPSDTAVGGTGLMHLSIDCQICTL